MQDHNATQPAAFDEALLDRAITFRNSTFGALKAYIRVHKRRTGITLTNSAAVDMLLRNQLAYDLHPAVVGEMLKLSRPSAAQALQAIPSGISDDGPAMGSEAPQSDEGRTPPPTPSPSRLTRCTASVINVSVTGPRRGMA